MANHLISAEIVPTNIASGATARTEIEYQAEQAAVLRIDFDDSEFDVSPGSVSLPASQAGFEPVDLRITRLGSRTQCVVTFCLFDDRDPDAVEVQ